MNTCVELAIQSQENFITDAALVCAALRLIKDVPGLASVTTWRRWRSTDNARPIAMYLTLDDDADPREVVKSLLKATRVRRAEKRFDESKGKVIYAIHNDDLDIEVISGAPTRCEVERVEIEETVPERIEPAHIEKRVVFRLKNPACLEGKLSAAPVPMKEESA